MNCVKVEVVVLGSPSLIVCTDSVAVKQHCSEQRRYLRSAKVNLLSPLNQGTDRICKCNAG